MATRTVLVTPRGRAIYPHLNRPDTQFDAAGVYSVKVAVPQRAAETLVEQLDKLHADAIAKARKENPKAKKIKESNLPYELDEENDEVIFNVKMKASFKDKKSGDTIQLSPALFDAKGKPLSKDVRIGGGSTVRVSFEPFAYYTAVIGAGVTLRLKAVQVIELRSFGGPSADSFGFEEEEGFSADDAPANDFDDEDETEDTESDDSEETEDEDDTDGSDF